MIWNFFIGFYAVVTAFALAMMIRERLKKSNFRPMDFVLGVLACIAWPLVWVFVMIAAWRRPATH